MPDAVRYAVAKRVAHIVLDRAPVNALSLDMIRAVIAALRQAAADDAARAVVLSSAVARHFCAGLDLAVLLGKSRDQVFEFVHALYVELHESQCNLGKPSIAAVGGSARGGGMTMAISCDVILAGQSATFGYPEINIGVLPAIHFARLPRIAGRHRAFELLFSGRTFAAQEAYELGLVSKVVPDTSSMRPPMRWRRISPRNRRRLCARPAQPSCARTTIGAGLPTRSRISAMS
jgi:enoyl-CoA hydratase